MRKELYSVKSSKSPSTASTFIMENQNPMIEKSQSQSTELKLSSKTKQVMVFGIEGDTTGE